MADTPTTPAAEAPPIDSPAYHAPLTDAVTSSAQVPTKSGSRYLQQLCKHWSHNMAVEFTPEHGSIVFPRDGRGGPWAGDGLVTLVAHPESLECRIKASEPRHLQGLKGALARHLDRFAFREAPLSFDWTDGAAGA